MSVLPRVTLIGHPYLPIGRGEHIRSIWRALRSVDVAAQIYSLPQKPLPDDPVLQALIPHSVTQIPGGIRLYHLNGDQLARAIEIIEHRQPGVFQAGYNIAFPAWELPRYPDEWAQQLNRFDEVWAASKFVADAVRAAVGVPVTHLTNACEPHLQSKLERGHFGLPEDCFLILFYFDLFSYSTRKNPWAAIETFRRTVAARPAAKIRLVLKLHNAAREPGIVAALQQAIADLDGRVTVINRTLSDCEIKNLIRCCDCFLSLHRSEGFGRGPAEAMFLGKPVIATGWSGNMEYMNAEVAFPIGYDLIPVKAGEYPAWQHQHWAEPKIAEAVAALLRLLDEPSLAQNTGGRAQAHMLRFFSDTVLGQRYRERFQAIMCAAGMRSQGRDGSANHLSQ